MLGKVTGVWRLTRDIELKYLQSGVAVATLGLANSEKFTSNGEKKENTCFIDASVFGKLAEVANQYLRKGSQVYIVADLSFEQWIDQNGQKRSKHKLKIDSFEMLGNKNDNQGQQQGQNGYNQPQQPQQGQSYQQPQQQQAYQAPDPTYEQQQNDGSYRPAPPPNDVPSIDVDEDEIPF